MSSNLVEVTDGILSSVPEMFKRLLLCHMIVVQVPTILDRRGKVVPILN
jgi:hypothetical protein